jgi:RimJ/RimL family protein N-acetyltransferase
MAAPPDRRVLEGPRVRVEPFEPATHQAALFDALHDETGDPHLWEYLPYGPFTRGEWREWFAGAAASEDPLFFALVVDGAPLGQASYLRIEPEHGAIEIGHIALGPALQRTAAATEAMYLMARHAFDDLGYRRLEWKCNAVNARSCRAAERLGFTFEGVFRQHMIVKGKNRDSAWFSIIDGEWPERRAALEAWLDPANFDGNGRQLRSLGEMRI